MKRSKPLLRKTPLQQVSAQLTRSQEASKTSKQRRAAGRRQDLQWREQVLVARGMRCRAALTLPGQCDGPLEVDHMIPRRPSTRWAVEDGLPLCRHHHRLKTEHLLLIDPAWLDEDQIIWLSDHQHAEWLLDGVVVGAHRRLFADGPDRRETDR